MIVVGGPWSQRANPAGVAGLADTLGWPVLADPLSGSRSGGAIGAADAIVRTEPPLPECIVVLGTPWLSRALGTFVVHAADAGARVIVVDPWRQWADPLRVATEFHQCEVDRWLDAAIATAAPSDPQWIDSWRAREAKAQKAIAEVLGTDVSEPLVAREVHRHAARTGATLVAAASMPIRDLEWYAEPGPTPPRVLANRGVNGIDGVVSTALGIAASGNGEGTHTVALMGDLTFLHDVSGLVNLPEVPCLFVVLDNGGGGIFSFLPQAATVEPMVFEQLFGTPPTTDIGAVARGFGLPVQEISELSELESALAAPASVPSLVRVKVPGRPENVALHEAVNQAVRLALQ
jgi:2-succinyl-5-enolpyruvyl-6-hydroxy-3-cyclohexene-1-carboxylate synthase